VAREGSRKCGSESTSPGSPKEVALVWNPREHAEALLWWLRARATEDRLFHPDMLRHYKAMCDTLNLEPRAWATVAKAFTELTTGRKVFAWVRLEDGSKHRWRIYPLTTRREDRRSTPPHEVRAARGTDCLPLRRGLDEGTRKANTDERAPVLSRGSTPATPGPHHARVLPLPMACIAARHCAKIGMGQLRRKLSALAGHRALDSVGRSGAPRHPRPAIRSAALSATRCPNRRRVS